MKKVELVRLFREYACPLPDDVVYIVLELAGLVRSGRVSCYFSINRNFFLITKKNKRRWQRRNRLG